jgi:hypothetical protein
LIYLIDEIFIEKYVIFYELSLSQLLAVEPQETSLFFTSLNPWPVMIFVACLKKRRRRQHLFLPIGEESLLLGDWRKKDSFWACC